MPVWKLSILTYDKNGADKVLMILFMHMKNRTREKYQTNIRSRSTDCSLYNHISLGWTTKEIWIRRDYENYEGEYGGDIIFVVPVNIHQR